MKHIVCFSGGHSSAIVAIEVARKFGIENTILVNHDINKSVEVEGIKRFKQQVADYIGLPVTYVNIKGLPANKLPTQFEVVMQAKAFKVGSGSELCTSRLKTEPFHNYLAQNFPDKDAIIYYGFDADEPVRIQRRVGVLSVMGYRSEYPLAHWSEDTRTIHNTMQVGIPKPEQYKQFKHGNCIGCLKAGRQHWYIVYCTRYDIYQEAIAAENYIGYTIDPEYSLEELAVLFEQMKQAGFPQNENIPYQRFWADVRRAGISLEPDEANKPCACLF